MSATSSADHRLVLDDQNAHGRNALQLAARLVEAALGRLGLDAEDLRGIGHGEALEHGEQEHLALQGRHVGERFLEPAADAVFAARLFQSAERLLQAVEQREDAELGVLRLGDEVGLLHGDLGAQAHPFVAAFPGSR